MAVGTGNLGAKDVVYAAFPELRQSARAPRMLPQMPVRTDGRVAGQRIGDGALPILGLVSGMVVHYAGCCHPLPGDRIVGIVTTGKGVTIHTNDCQTLESFAATPERFIDVEWDYTAAPTRNGAGKPATHTGRISVISVNTPNALANLTNAIVKHDGALMNLKIVNRQNDFFEVLVDVDVRDIRHLSTVIAGLRGTTGITQVERARG